jgi:hypothetical protein
LHESLVIDEVVFAEKGDWPLLGVWTLEGLNLTVDPRSKKLVTSEGRTISCGLILIGCLLGTVRF